MKNTPKKDENDPQIPASVLFLAIVMLVILFSVVIGGYLIINSIQSKP